MFREARAAAAIDHPNVAGVYEVGEVDGHPYIAMAHVEGQNLEERILEGPLEIRKACTWRASWPMAGGRAQEGSGSS